MERSAARLRPRPAPPRAASMSDCFESGVRDGEAYMPCMARFYYREVTPYWPK